MWLTYVDESGNTGARLDDPNQPYHVIVGVSVREDVVERVASHLDDVVASALGIPGRTKATELHAAQLQGGRGAWAGIRPADRISAYGAALEPLSWEGVHVSHAAIDKPKFAPRLDGRHPHLWALQFLMEKLDAWFKANRERTLLVADETNEHEQFALDLLIDLQTGRPRPGLDFGAIKQIVDTMHFVRSETNRGVQLADLVAYLRGRILSRPTAATEVERKLWADLVQPSVVTWREPWPSR